MAAPARARSARFDWSLAIASFWTAIGVFSDVGYHVRHRADTFFTVDHALLYSGLLLLFGILAVELVRRLLGGFTGRAILPPGYTLSLLGLALFFLGGIADLAKHEAFGFERDFDALLSPTHLLIGIGIAVAVCGPLRSALVAPRPRELVAQLPAVISMATVLELLHFATHPFFRANLERWLASPLPSSLTSDAITLQTLRAYELGGGLASFIIQSLLMTGAALYLVRNFRLRPGALTVLFVLGNVLIGFADALSPLEALAVIVPSIVAGVCGDLFLRDVERLQANRLRFGCFCFIVPAAYHAVLLIFTALFLGGIWWDPSVAAGAVIDAGIFGLFLGFVAFMPRPHIDAT